MIRNFRENSNDDRVGLYVGTYKKYNNGSLFGKWMYPADYDSLEDFLDACRKVHKDEKDPELMFQDCDNLPSSLYSEYGFSQEAFDYAKYIDENYSNSEAAEAYINLFNTWDEDDFDDRYVGQFDSNEDFAWDFIEQCGGIENGVSHPEDYFDYESFGRDLSFDMDDEEDEHYLSMSDSERGEAWVEDVYGSVEDMINSGVDIENYFDIEKFARDLMYDYSEDNGYYFNNY